MIPLTARLIAHTLRGMNFAGCFPGRERTMARLYITLIGMTPVNAITICMAIDVVALLIIRWIA